ncbi:MAG: hypothetical protein RL095_735 [Verrucomicrobiota bacterium]|jgi:type II secretory pathway pseudopilin PulG
MQARKFTLIELLMVIAVILVLVSLLSPSFNRARALSKRVVCLSGMKQLGMMTQQYAITNKGLLPRSESPSVIGEECTWYPTTGFRGLALMRNYSDRDSFNRLFRCPNVKSGPFFNFDIESPGQGPLQYRGYNSQGQMRLTDSTQAIIADYFSKKYYTASWYVNNGFKDISHNIRGAAGYGVVYKDGHGRLHNDPSRAISQMAASNHFDTGSEGGWTYFDANP